MHVQCMVIFIVTISQNITWEAIRYKLHFITAPNIATKYRPRNCETVFRAVIGCILRAHK